MIIRVTGSFAKQIGVTVTATLPLCENPVADWTCRVFSLREGEPVLLVTVPRPVLWTQVCGQSRSFPDAFSEA